jgi:hypothetical protein
MIRPKSLSWSLVLVISAIGCGGGPAASQTSTAPTAAAPPAPDSAAIPGLAALRPAGADAVLVDVGADPSSADAVARAALLYASSDVAGMTLLWSMTYGALEPGGPQSTPLASAIASVFRERIEIVDHGDATRVSTRLAPGSAIGIAQPDGSARVPLAYLVEMGFAMGIGAGHGAAPGSGGWSLASIAAALRAYVSVGAQMPTPLSAANLELDAWLRGLREAGHLDAFVHGLVGPAFPEEFAAYQAANAPAIETMRAYVATNPFRPTQPVFPDDLVPMTGR